MSDLISRQDAIDEICMDWCGVHHKGCTHPFGISHDDYYYCEGCGDVETIKALPSAEPERKTGKWIHNRDEDGWHIWLECSECGTREDNTNAKFCPNCGSYNGG